jgi:putative copper resistance protein D
MVFVALFIQWSRADGREAAREDRRLDRAERLDRAAQPADTPPTPESDLAAQEAAYNAWLARLAAGDSTATRRPGAGAGPAPG